MKFTRLEIPDLVLIEPKVFGDDRGFFYESFNRQVFAQGVGADPDFVQDNHSRSSRGVLRGLHYQIQQAQGKLVRVVQGRVFDVAVDLRRASPTFGQWVGQELSDENGFQLFIPEGFAHGFQILSEEALVAYKVSDFYNREAEGAIRWNDDQIGIHWPLADPILGPRDVTAPLLRDYLPEKLSF